MTRVTLRQTRVPTMTASSFIEALYSDKPAVDRADKMRLYGWLIGGWTFAATVHRDDGTLHQGRGEIHFGWVLEGRAIQDVWILPESSTVRRCASTIPESTPGTSFGATRCARSIRARSDAPTATTSSSTATTIPAKPCAGALRRLRPTRFAGPASVPAMTARPMTTRPGNCRPSSSLGACRHRQRRIPEEQIQ